MADDQREPGLTNTAAHSTTPIESRDWLLPAEWQGRSQSRRGAHTSKALGEHGTRATRPDSGLQGREVTYEDFGGDSHQLLLYEGVEVRLLLPLDWRTRPMFDGNPYTDDQIELLIHLLDQLYFQFEELIGHAPGPDPRGEPGLPVALLNRGDPFGNAGARGWVGAKGIELYLQTPDEPNQANTLNRQLQSGSLAAVFPHELAHNFDRFSARVANYIPDAAHAWTAYFELSSIDYAKQRMSFLIGSGTSTGGFGDNFHYAPIHRKQNTIVRWTRLTRDSNDIWSQCIVSGDCPNSQSMTADAAKRSLWSGVYFAYQELFGQEAVLASLRALETLLDQKKPANREEQETVRLVSLAVGAGQNLECLYESWGWFNSPTLTAELIERFPDPGGICSDGDVDGFSGLDGDCNNSNASVFPGAEELDDQTDNDCDGFVDETEFVSPSMNGEVGITVESGLAQVHAEFSDDRPQGAMQYRLLLEAGAEYTMLFCAVGELTYRPRVISPTGAPLRNSPIDVAEGACFQWDLLASESGDHVLRLDRTSEGYGPFEATIADTRIPLVPPPPELRIEQEAGQVFLYPTVGEEAIPGMNDPRIRVWINGVGMGLDFALPLVGGIAIDTSGWDPGETYTLSAQLTDGGIPRSPFSDPFAVHFTGASQFPIDSIASGAWYDPSHDGEGLILEVLDDGRVIAYWFTYPDPLMPLEVADRSQRWLIGFGEIIDDSIVFDSLFETSGGVFGPEFDPDLISLVDMGRASLAFHDCHSGRFNYTYRGVGGTLSVERLTQLAGTHCNGPTTKAPRSDFSGSWFDPSHNYEGITLEILRDNLALVYWFTYDVHGTQRWLYGVGTHAGQDVHFDELFVTAGPAFGHGFNPEKFTATGVGSLDLRLSCRTGDMQFRFTHPDFVSGSLNLEKLSYIKGLGC